MPRDNQGETAFSSRLSRDNRRERAPNLESILAHRRASTATGRLMPFKHVWRVTGSLGMAPKHPPAPLSGGRSVHTIRWLPDTALPQALMDRQKTCNLHLRRASPGLCGRRRPNTLQTNGTTWRSPQAKARLPLTTAANAAKLPSKPLIALAGAP